jgi:hypothetical protein
MVLCWAKTEGRKAVESGWMRKGCLTRKNKAGDRIVRRKETGESEVWLTNLMPAELKCDDKLIYGGKGTLNAATVEGGVEQLCAELKRFMSKASLSRTDKTRFKGFLQRMERNLGRMKLSVHNRTKEPVLVGEHGDFVEPGKWGRNINTTVFGLCGYGEPASVQLAFGEADAPVDDLYFGVCENTDELLSDGSKFKAKVKLKQNLEDDDIQMTTPLEVEVVLTEVPGDAK